MVRLEMNGVRLTASLIAAAAVVAIAAGAGRASYPGANGRLYLIGAPIGTADPGHVYSVAADGSGLTQLTSGSQRDLAVSASPDGSTLVVERDTGDQCGHLFWRAGYDLFTLGADGSPLSRLTNDCPTDEVSPSWSPSGRQLAFSSQGSIWISRADGTGRTRLTCTGGDDDFSPSWSPDGRLIAYSHIQDIDVMNVDGTNQHRVAAGWVPSFSPDGTKIAYGGGSDAPGIHVVNVDGSGDTRLTSGADAAPVWSPDGTQIAFVRRIGGAGVLETMHADGTDVTTVVDQVDVGDFAWARTSGRSLSEPGVTADQTACPETTPAAPPGPPPVTPPPSVPVVAPTVVDASGVQPPDRLQVVALAFKPKLLRSRKPFAVTFAIRDREGRAVRGALVRLTPVSGAVGPTGQLRTGGFGTVTARLTPTRQLRLRRGGRLVLAVHVRRPGAPWSGDVSGLRLVSVRTAPAER